MLDDNFIQTMKEKLLAEKSEVQAKLAELNKPEKPMDNPDLDDLANDATEDIIEESTRAAFHDILDKIDAALQRIADGRYGKCLKDGVEISRDKLMEEPWAEYCSGNH